MTITLIYLLFLLYIVARLFRRPAGSELDYIVAGRRLTLPAFVATMVSSWYGGILGVGEYAWSYGVSNWLVFGVPYYIYAVVFALFLAARARRSRVLTLPELLNDRYGATASIIGATVLFVMTVPAAYVLMLGVLVNIATGWPLWVGVVLGTALSISYVFRGGLRAVVSTDILQFFLMFLGFLILVPFCVRELGGWSSLKHALPADHLVWDGGRGAQAVAVWYFIALSTLVEPIFYQRCYAARSESTARRGLLISVAFWIFFDFLTTTAGLYARALLPDLNNPVAAFPLLAERVLPPLLRGLFMTGLLATIMSTIDSSAFISAVTGGRDIVGRLRGQSGDEQGLHRVRWALLLSGVLAVGMALWSGSVIRLWHHLGSVGAPALLLPVLAAHSPWRPRPGRVSKSMVLSVIVALFWLSMGRGNAWLGVEAIFPGLLTSVLILLPGTRRVAHWTTGHASQKI